MLIYNIHFKSGSLKWGWAVWPLPVSTYRSEAGGLIVRVLGQGNRVRSFLKNKIILLPGMAGHI